MKLHHTICSPRSGSLPFTVEWRPEGWHCDFVHHRGDTEVDGTNPGHGGYDVDRLMVNEMIRTPSRHAHFRQELREDGKDTGFTEETARNRVTAFMSWIAATTRAYPGDSVVYHEGD